MASQFAASRNPSTIAKGSPCPGDASTGLPADFLPRRLRLVLRAAAGMTLAMTLVALPDRTLLMPSRFGPPRSVGLTTRFFLEQDAVLLLACAAFLLGLSFLRLPAPRLRIGELLGRRRFPWIAGLVVLTFGITLAGTFLVFGDFDLSRDEILADFDSVVLRSGRLFVALPVEWRPFARALNPDFMLPVAGHTGWISAYLPVNAGLRALAGLIFDPSLTGPLLACIAVLALIAVARRLWPERRDAVFVSVLLLVTSSQFLLTGMTSYAMTAHLAFNLVWLWLFLRDDRPSHAAAIAVGFLAAGLHQLVFHPLFAAPFILRLWRMRRRHLALVYTIAYATTCLFWMSYFQLVLGAYGAEPGATSGAGLVYFFARAAVLVADFSIAGAMLMLKNGLRFIAWQNPLAFPFALAAWTAIRGREGLARPLFEGLVLTFLAMFIILPYQGHGWGYRYLHGLLGSLCLLAGYGWIAVGSGAAQGALHAARGALAAAGLIAACPALIVHGIEARAFVAPYRRALATIEGAPAPIVIVDRSGLLFAGDLVRNDPYLRNAPKMLDLTYLDENLIGRICGRLKVAIFDKNEGMALGIQPDDTQPRSEVEARAKLRAYMAGLSCGTELARSETDS